MNIQQEIDELLKKKGVPPPHMTKRQCFAEFGRRLVEELPRVLEETIRRISGDIARDEMTKAGRSVVCRPSPSARGRGLKLRVTKLTIVQPRPSNKKSLNDMRRKR